MVDLEKSDDRSDDREKLLDQESPRALLATALLEVDELDLEVPHFDRDVLEPSYAEV